MGYSGSGNIDFGNSQKWQDMMNAGNWGSHTSSGSHVDQYLKAPGPPVGPPAPTPPGQCSSNPGQNNNGVNLESTARSASSPEQCCSLCAAAAGCKGYTHVTANKECWLKSSLGAL